MEIFQNSEIICFDAKSLIHTLKKSGVSIGEKTKFFDVMLYAYLLSPGNGEATLESLASEFLGMTVPKDSPSPEAICGLEDLLRKRLREIGMENLLDEIELPLASILAEMEEVGFKIDCAGILK